jgi:hypothetical protein
MNASKKKSFVQYAEKRTNQNIETRYEDRHGIMHTSNIPFGNDEDEISKYQNIMDILISFQPASSQLLSESESEDA